MKSKYLFNFVVLVILWVSVCGLAKPIIHEKKSSDRSKKTLELPVRVLVSFNKKDLSDLYQCVDADSVKSRKTRATLKKFHVNKLVAAYRNRYTSKGILKPTTQTGSDNWFFVSLNNKARAFELVNQLKKNTEILDAYLEQPILIKPCDVTSGFDYINQWHLTKNSGINVEEAWNINKGRNDVIIAVCDGGVDYTHPNLDSGDRSRVISGYDSGSDDNDPMDDLPTNSTDSYAGHGTHVAGIIGAMATSTNKISGVMQRCKIMPVKMVGSGSIKVPFIDATLFDFSTTAFPSDVADAIDYAVNNGANVINLSYGFYSIGFPVDEVILRMPLLYSAISNAYNHNVLVVAAMGNDHETGNPTNYPAAFYSVMGIGNTNINKTRSSTSSTGPHISVSAPGTSILSTTRGGGVGIKSGTSMATPVVAGVAGLVFSQGLDRNFNLTNNDVRHILEITADDVSPAGFDNETGYGVVNAYNALKLLDVPNMLYHRVAVGGTATKLMNLSKWIVSGANYGLASGIYLDVDQYQISQHVTFETPFVTPPKVWLRERESLAMSFANPNSSHPFADITNVTTTGFDVRSAAYYVRYSSSGQTLNKWVPETLPSVKVAYTVVGMPAAVLSGSSQICTQGTYTLDNLPAGATVIWSAAPSGVVSLQPNGSSVTLTKVGSGKVTLSATINNSVTVTKDIWVGAQTSFTGSASVNYLGMGTWNSYVSCTGPYIYQWWLRKANTGVASMCVSNDPELTLRSVAQGTAKLAQSAKPPIVNQPVSYTIFYMFLRVTDASGFQYDTPEQQIYAYGKVDLVPALLLKANNDIQVSDQVKSMEIFPNPASSEVKISVNPTSSSSLHVVSSNSSDNTNLNSYSVNVIDVYGSIVYTDTKIAEQFTIPISKLRNGVYSVIVSDGTNTYQNKLIVKH
jgi:subtilisin family serine protease